MTEIEIQLYAIDENAQNLRYLAYQANTKKFLAHSNQINPTCNVNNFNHVT